MKKCVMMVGIVTEIRVPSSCGDDGRTLRKGKMDECVILCVNGVLGK